MATPAYVIKGLKTLKSGAYTATLYLNGKKVADLEYDGNGGSPRTWFEGEDYPARQAAEDAFVAWYRVNVPSWHWSFEHREDAYGIESAISYVIDVADFVKMSKRGTVHLFRKPGSTDLADWRPDAIYTQSVSSDAGRAADQVAAARAEGLQVWDNETWGWVA